MQRQPSVLDLDACIDIIAQHADLAREMCLELMRARTSASLVDVANRLVFIARQAVEMHARIAGLKEESHA